VTRPIEIDLVSDTSTKPSPAMLAAMVNARVGDEQRDEDPTVLELNARVADLLGMESALFLPSGTMCNQIAFLVHCRPGDEIITAANAHVFGSEGAGASALAGAQFRTLPTTNGVFQASDVEAAIRAPRHRSPRSRLVSVEQTANRGGGSVWPVATLGAVAAVARAHGLAMHMDGARLMNAVVASNVSAADFSAPFDTMWLDLSKGLGCPFGAVLLGSKAVIEDAWQWKQRMGGAMRQAGVIAAAGTYALENHVRRLAEDHANAKFFAERVAEIPGIAIDVNTVETNLVFFDVAKTGLTAGQVHDRLLEHGVRIGASGGTRMRAVTHLDVSRDQLAEAAAALSTVVVEAAAA